MFPGDRVSYINDNLSGTVKRIIDKKQVLILLDDGFEIPAQISELVVIKSVNGNSNSAKPEDENLVVAENEDKSNKLFFAAITEDTGKGQLVKCYLVNTTQRLLQFSLFKSLEGRITGLAHGEIEASRAMKLMTFDMAEASDYRNLSLHYMFFDENPASLEAPGQLAFKIKPVALFKDRNMIPVLKQGGYLINLTDLAAGKAPDMPLYQKQTSKPEPQPDIVDLHLEELTARPKDLPPHEAIQLQISVFSQCLDKAIAQDLPHITFIHGVGKGVLKDNIRKALGSNPFVIGFEDANVRQFGFGATIVYLKGGVIRR